MGFLFKKIVVCACLAGIVSGAFAVKASAGTDVTGLVDAVKGFQYGQSRKPLIAVENAIREASGSPEKLQAIETAMNSSLVTGGTIDSKQFICQQLGLIGTSRSVGTLAAMLKDTKTAPMSLMALERIGGGAVETVLLAELNNTKGDVKIGVINVLGAIKSEQSVKTIGALALSSDKKIAVASIAALGNIATAGARKKLSVVLKKDDPSLKAVVQQVLLESVDNSAKGAKSEYRAIYKDPATTAIKAAAFKGMVAASGGKGTNLIIKGLKSDDVMIQDVAVSSIPGVKDDKNLSKIFGSFDKLSPDAQYKLLSCGEQIGTPAVFDAAYKSVSSEDEKVRLAAMKALKNVGGVDAVGVLLTKASTAGGTEQKVARECLYGLKGTGVDKKIVAIVKSYKDNKQVAELVMAIGQRRIAGTADLLATYAASSDSNVSTQAFRSLAMAGKGSDLGVAVDLLVNLKNESNRSEAEKCIAAIVVSNKADIKPILSAIQSSKDEKVKASLIAVLGKTGSPDAFEALRKALDDPDDNVKIAAIRSLSQWRDGSAAMELLKVSKTSSNETHKILSLRGFIKLVPLVDQKASEKVDLLKEGMELCSNVNEKRMVLSSLSAIASVESLQLCGVYLDDASIQKEAAAAVLKMANNRNLKRRNSKQISEVLTKMAGMGELGSASEKAKEMLKGKK